MGGSRDFAAVMWMAKWTAFREISGVSVKYRDLYSFICMFSRHFFKYFKRISNYYKRFLLNIFAGANCWFF